MNITKHLSRLLTAAALLSSASLALAQTPSLNEIGDLPGDITFSRGLGISADGTRVTGYSRSDTGSITGEFFLWDSGSLERLGDLGGDHQSAGNAISADGTTLVGQSSSANGTEAFIWTRATGMVGLGTFAGGSYPSSATSVSGNGSVVTGYAKNSGGTTQAFRWTSGTMTSLGGLAGEDGSSAAFDISSDGNTIVGSADSGSGQVAFRWNDADGMTSLGDLAGGATDSRANSVSANGLVVVGYGTTENGKEAMRWTESGGMTGLGTLSEVSSYSEALDASADGSIIVGTSSIGSGVNHAFIWDAVNGMQDLNVIAASLGLDLDGWVLIAATGISADGKTITGWGTRGPHNDGFVLTIPEPSSMLLVISSAGLLLGYRRRSRR